MIMATLTQHHEQHGARLVDVGGVGVPGNFGDVEAEYRALREGCGLHDRSYRGLLEVAGADRADWLHNLTTNEIKALSPGQGNYVFGLNVKGRILFDGNVLALPEVLLLDLDRRAVSEAMQHMQRYVVMEDVQLTPRSDHTGRFAVVGPQSAELVAELGVASPGDMKALQHATVAVSGIDCHLLRHDFAGPPAFEILLPGEHQLDLWKHVQGIGEAWGLRPVGLQALQVVRVENGMPWSVEDIDGDVLPAETGQLQRVVSFNKGCYLGQEVVERMRAHQALARVLVGLKFRSGRATRGAVLEQGGHPVGRVTSAVDSFEIGGRIGLGYVKTAAAQPGSELQAVGEGYTDACRVSALPFGTFGRD